MALTCNTRHSFLQLLHVTVFLVACGFAFGVMSICSINSRMTITFQTVKIESGTASMVLTPFFRTDLLLYHTFQNMVLFRPGNLYMYSLCSPGNQDYQKIIHFFIKKGRSGQIALCKSCILLELVGIINES